MDAQTAGPLIVLGAFTAAEMSAKFLDAFPGSAFAWYLNLEVFHSFAVARGEVTPLRVLLGSDALALDLILIALVLLARIGRHRLGIAFLANLSFGIAVALSYAWLSGAAHPHGASLLDIVARQVSDAALVGVLLVASLAAFLKSHLAFLREIRVSRPMSLTRRPDGRQSGPERMVGLQPQG